MIVKKQVEIEVTIIMDETEAQWLKGIMQNPINNVVPEKERDQDREMREMFWNVLDREGVALI
ncbi:hypothetical protein KAU11_00450 [Candidatus Babeliales bacterium]|nr:hypothetical protein [Candidatus Babeliales bacterium]